MITLKVSLYYSTKGEVPHWNWLVGNPFDAKYDSEGGGCLTPEQALKEALYAVEFNSVSHARVGGNA